MGFITELIALPPKPFLMLLVLLLGVGFVSVSIMNKDLRAKLRAARRELSAILKQHPKQRTSKKPCKRAGVKTSNVDQDEVAIPPRPT